MQTQLTVFLIFRSWNMPIVSR